VLYQPELLPPTRHPGDHRGVEGFRRDPESRAAGRRCSRSQRALLAAAILPLSTAYSVSEATGHEASLDDSFQEARFFYVTYGLVVALGAAIVLVPGIPLIGVLFFTQVVNAVLLLPLLVVMIRIARDREVMGDYRNGPVGQTLAYAAAALVGLSLVALAAASFF